jgi:multicomponent Na+:H+ antiporter subunit A
LPKFLPLSVDSVKYRDAVVSLLFGGLITVLLLNVISVPMVSDLKTYFGNNSLSLGKGLNVVNVILVDFRALDTLGEAIVLAAAALGIYSLLKLRIEK